MEVRLIDANAFHKKIMKDYDNDLSRNENIAQFILRIETAPTIEAEPVRHGRWIVEDDCEHFIARCSECGRSEDSRMIAKMPYCHCGTKMDLYTPTEVALDIADNVMMGGSEMKNESWFTDDFNRCDNCPDWDDKKGCKSHGKGCDFEGPDNECI